MRTEIVALLLLLMGLKLPVDAQSAIAEKRLETPSPRPALLDPGPSIGGADMPVPEGGILKNSTYSNQYFGFAYQLPPSWQQSFAGPPPSDTGYYVLAQFRLPDTPAEMNKGTILISAADQFFATQKADSPRDLLENMKARLNSVYQVEAPPREIKLGDRTYVRLDYNAPAAGLHWSILATEIRCHIVEFVLTSRDPRLLESLIQSVNRMRWPAAATAFDDNHVPVCIPDYATEPNLLSKVEPVFAGPRFTNIPVRIVIGRNGKVKHIHVLNAFPAQAEHIKAALTHWEFKPYVQDGRPLEVETGILFEFPPRKPQGRPAQNASRSQ